MQDKRRLGHPMKDDILQVPRTALPAPHTSIANCMEGSLLVLVYGHNMSDDGMCADFAKYSEENYALSHSYIFLHAWDSGTYELSAIAVDIVGANTETVCTSFNEANVIAEWVAKSSIVLAEYDGSSKVFAFATHSYQTAHSRTVEYAIQKF